MHWGDDYERQMYEDLIKGYTAKNPNAKINQIYTPDDYYTKLQTMISSKTTPDVFGSPKPCGWYGKAGILEDLGWVYKKYPTLVDDLIQVFANSASTKEKMLLRLKTGHLWQCT